MGVGRVIAVALLLDEKRVYVVARVGLIERDAMRGDLLHEEPAHFLVIFEGALDAKHVEWHAVEESGIEHKQSYSQWTCEYSGFYCSCYSI